MAAPGTPAAAPPQVVDVRDQATRLAEWVQAQQEHPDADNRWPLFVDAATRMAGAWELFTLTDGPIAAFVEEDPDKNSGVLDPTAIVTDPAHARFIPELRKFFDTLAKTKVLYHLDEVASPSRFVALRATEPLINTDMPELGNGRTAARLCAARIHIMLLDGNADEAVRSLAHALGIARAVQGRGARLGYLVSVACWTTATREVATNVLEGRINADTAKAMLELLESEPPDGRIGLGGERYFVVETLEAFFDKAKREAAARQEQGLTPEQEQAIDKGMAALASREEQVAEAHKFFDACQNLFSADAAERAQAQSAIDEVNTRIGALGERPPGSKAYKPLVTVLPSTGTSMQSGRRARMLHAGTRAMLALEAFRARTGSYPESLEALVPADINAVPLDPFAEGKPFSYRRIESSGGTAATAYVLYSLGADGEDNGGKPHPRNPANATGPQGRGYDAVINGTKW